MAQAHYHAHPRRRVYHDDVGMIVRKFATPTNAATAAAADDDNHDDSDDADTVTR